MNKIKVEWNVIIRDSNTDKFKKFNVFNNGKFLSRLLQLKKEIKEELLTFGDFNKRLDSQAKYAFWAKSEYEIMLTDLFCAINKEEIDRIKKINNESKITNINLLHYKKIDIYQQLLLNWDKFSNYVWKNISGV